MVTRRQITSIASRIDALAASFGHFDDELPPCPVIKLCVDDAVGNTPAERQLIAAWLRRWEQAGIAPRVAVKMVFV